MAYVHNENYEKKEVVYYLFFSRRVWVKEPVVQKKNSRKWLLLPYVACVSRKSISPTGAYSREEAQPARNAFDPKNATPTWG